MNTNTQKYIIVFLLTCGIFGGSWFLSNYASQRKFAELQSIQNKVSVDVLASETQYSLLEQTASCEEIDNTELSSEIGSLAEKLNYSEQNVGNPDDITLMKKQYTILEVKDFLLTKRMSDKCGKKFITILYFYGNDKTCTDCEKEGFVLDALRQKYPLLRVYSFDNSLDLSTIKALRGIYKIDGTVLPALVVEGKTLTGFQKMEDIEPLFPNIATTSNVGKK